MVNRFLHCAALVAFTSVLTGVATFGQPVTPSRPYVAPAEFEPQEYIWLSWVEQGWLGGAPFSGATLDVMRAITPHVRVRLMFSAFTADEEWGKLREGRWGIGTGGYVDVFARYRQRRGGGDGALLARGYAAVTTC